jgi:hypothetical protein
LTAAAEPAAVTIRGIGGGFIRQWANPTTLSGRRGREGAMMSRKAKKQVLARKRLAELKPAELNGVSGGFGYPFPSPFPFRRHHRHHHRFHFFF